MKNRSAWPASAATLIATLACASAAHAAATVTPLADTSPASAQLLVDALLGASGGGVGVVAGSAQYTGAASASGLFTNGGGSSASGVGFDSGVVLTTGDARFLGSSAAFAGDSANKSVTFTAGAGNALTANNAPGNALFAAMAPFGNTNASILSFQFVPQQGFLTLSLVFASEDYNDVVNSGFPTDVIGVFVNGVNQALVPGSNLAISASTINCGGPTSGAANGVGAQNCNLFRDNAPFSGVIDSELDGFTVAIDLRMPVLAGQVNTIAIGLADSLDSSGDSALLLRAASVSAVPEPATYALLLAGLAGVAALRRRTARG